MENLLVVKAGGGEGVSLESVCDDIAAVAAGGRPVVLVHGGSHETNELSRRLGAPPVFLRSPSGHTSRRTDRAALEVFTMACCGKINKSVVERLQARGVNAVGLSGMDGRTWEGTRKPVVRSVVEGRVVLVRDDYTGRVERVNTALIASLLEGGFTPVLTPPAISYENEAINVDADRAAAATAAALGATELLLLSNVPGLLRVFTDEDSLIASVAYDECDEWDAALESARGRMKRKVIAAREALETGVGRVVIGDGRSAGAVTRALEGAGTVFA